MVYYFDPRVVQKSLKSVFRDHVQRVFGVTLGASSTTTMTADGGGGDNDDYDFELSRNDLVSPRYRDLEEQIKAKDSEINIFYGRHFEIRFINSIREAQRDCFDDATTDMEPWEMTHDVLIDLCTCENKSCVWDIICECGLEAEHPLPDGVDDRLPIGCEEDSSCRVRQDRYHGDAEIVPFTIPAGILPATAVAATTATMSAGGDGGAAANINININAYDNPVVLRKVYDIYVESSRQLAELHVQRDQLKAQLAEEALRIPMLKERMLAHKTMTLAMHWSSMRTFWRAAYHTRTNFVMCGGQFSPDKLAMEAALAYREGRDIALLEALTEAFQANSLTKEQCEQKCLEAKENGQVFTFCEQRSTLFSEWIDTHRSVLAGSM
jgi:hypothetical protein